MNDRWMCRAALIAVFAVMAVPFARAQGAETAPTSSAYSIPEAQLVQPKALESMLRTEGPKGPLVLQVGSHMLFDEAHIRGAVYAGPGSQQAGQELLRSRVAQLPRTKAIVIYCGCCPWQRCPNIGPAFAVLREMGFTNVKALYLAENFGADWVAKGYPVEQSH